MSKKIELEELFKEKIEDAKNILVSFGLPENQQNKLSALTLLALCNLRAEDEWTKATKKSMSVVKDIIEFVNSNYNEDYKVGSRESFRKIALKPFIENNIAVLNPNDRGLSQNSSKTHYALSDVTFDTLRKYKSPEWEDALAKFKLLQFPKNIPSSNLLRIIEIKNYKSILEDKIELGRVNVFIGVNGCGKTNILEAIATISAAKAHDLNFEGLYARGVRIARPNLMTSSFFSKEYEDTIDITLHFELDNQQKVCKSLLSPENRNDIYTKWFDKNEGLNESELPNIISNLIVQIYQEKGKDINNEDLFKDVNERLAEYKLFDQDEESYHRLLADYAIFDLNTKSLRGVTPADSRKTPLGINGEGLDLLIATFNGYEKDFLDSTTQTFFDWLAKIQTEKDEKVKSSGLKAGRSLSTLYFRDRFMQKKNDTFSAENSNEGILHALFYLALFISNKTPDLFAIDNIETALNPRLCQKLITELVILSKERGKQALITTHNPAVLDGLNLMDDDQRLFVVYRDSEGRTKTRRIKFKSDLSDKQYKLSEMWLKGQLGAVPQNF